MANRLTENQKLEILGKFRQGSTAKVLAEAFGCSPATITRTVKALLSNDEYISLKANRNKGKLIDSDLASNESINLIIEEESLNKKELNTKEINDDLLVETSNIFHEIVPLSSDIEINELSEITSKSLDSEVLPSCVYMLVDKNVELETKALKDFPELGTISEDEKNLQAISLFSNQRSAKRSCGRNQRVIKVPDSTVFGISSSFLLAKGITHLVLEGDLISLES